MSQIKKCFPGTTGSSNVDSKMDGYELGKLKSIDFLLKPFFFFSKTLSQVIQFSSIINRRAEYPVKRKQTRVHLNWSN